MSLNEGNIPQLKKLEPKKPAAGLATASNKKPSVLDRAPLLKQLSETKDVSPSPPSSPAPHYHHQAPASQLIHTNNSSNTAAAATNTTINRHSLHQGNGHATNGSVNNGNSAVPRSAGVLNINTEGNGVDSSVSNQRLEELTSELQKMKTIILKHEMRIRELEKKVEQTRGTLSSSASPTLKTQQSLPASHGKNGEWELLPDEV